MSRIVCTETSSKQDSDKKTETEQPERYSVHKIHSLTGRGATFTGWDEQLLGPTGVEVSYRFSSANESL